MPAAMLCRLQHQKHRNICCTVGQHKTKYAWIVEADESMRIRMEGSQNKNHEDHIAGRGMNSSSHCNLVHKFSFASSHENTRCKGSSGERMGNIGENTGVWPDESQKQIWSDRWSKDEGRKSSFCFTDGPLSFEECRIGDKAPKVQRQSCTPTEHCQRWFRLSCSIYRTRIISVSNDGRKSNVYHIQTTRMRRTSSRRSISLHTGQMEDAQSLLKIPKSECPDNWIRLPKQKWPKSWSSMEDPVVPLERNLYGHPLAGILWERQFEKILLQHGWEKVSNCECLFVHREKGLFLSVHVDDIKLAGKKYNIDPMWKVLNKEVELGEPTSFLDHVYLGCTQRQCEISKDIVDNCRKMIESRISAEGIDKLLYSEKSEAHISSWSCDMEGHAKKCVERCCELANKTTQQLHKVATPCFDDNQFKGEEMGSVGELSKVCAQIVLKFLYLARIGRPDTLWSVNKLARAITKWTRACNKRLARLISYIHHTCEHKQYCYVGNTAKQCRLGLFQDSDFAGDLEDSKSTSGGTLCIFLEAIRLFQSVGCARNKLQFHTVQQNQKSFLWMQDWG